MNTIITSRDAILTKSREIVMEKGISSINMRTVANTCGVAVGSIYNYFPSKADLISATVEDIWKDIFHMKGEALVSERFIDCLDWLFGSIQTGCLRYPNFFTLHSVSFASNDKTKGRMMMESYIRHMKQCLLNILLDDVTVRQDAFNEKLAAEDFVGMIFTLMLSTLLQGANDCKSILEMVSRCIY